MLDTRRTLARAIVWAVAVSGVAFATSVIAGEDIPRTKKALADYQQGYTNAGGHKAFTLPRSPGRRFLPCFPDTRCMIAPVLVFSFVTALPIKWAADFTGGQRTGWLACFVAAIVGPVLAVLAFRLLSGGFLGFSLSYLALVTTYAVILRVPGRSILGFSVLTLVPQLSVAMALISFGFGGPELILGL